MTSPDVAIVGMACVFPGARNLREYWENILAKVSAIGDPPADWEADLFVAPDVEANDRIYCSRGGYLGDLAEFEPLEYGVMPNAIDGGEPDHFLALRAAHEALTDAGYLPTDIDGARAEVVIGRGSYVNRGNTTAIQHGIIVDQVLRILKQLHPEHTDEELAALKQTLKASLPPFHAETAPALVPNIISGRIANRLDFMGPNYIVDAACASSLVAVDLGMRDLRSGRCDLAVVGGVHASTPPVIMMIFCQLKAISRTGQIRPFDRGADGTLLGEGVGMLVLKRLEDAERDGNRIYAVLKEVGTASDGRALGPLAPRVEGEELALRRAYETAGIDPETVGLLEAHGTGTAVGDAVEIDALRRVFGTSNGHSARALGSVKSMIGHLMPASGIAALIKVALALHHKVLPPTLNCDDPNPALDLAGGGFYINSETRPWLHGRPDAPRRAGVNAFGFGGINAHAVLEEHRGAAETFSLAHRWDTELVILSAASRESLADATGRLRTFADAQGDVALNDLAFTLNVGTDLGPLRLAIVAGTPQDLAQKLVRAEAALRDPRCTRLRDKDGIYFFDRQLSEQGDLAFVFPGEGSQYPNMLADLCLHFPVVRSTFDFMDRAFIGHPRGYLPSEVIFPSPLLAPDRLWEMDAGAEAVFAANQAMAALLRQLQIRPRFMTGHSTGEHSALLASGIIRVGSEEELIEHVRGVNASFERLKSAGDIPEGVLVAVGGVDRSVLASLVDRSGGALHIALDNCPHQVVLCGTQQGVAAAMRELEALRAICQPLPFQRAYHTPWFESFCAPLRAYFDRVRIGPSDIEVYSCVTAQPLPPDPDVVRSLVASQWARPVRFRDTVEALYARGARIFVEVGPKANLTGFIEDTLRGRAYIAIPSNTAHRSGITQLNHLIGQLAAHGVPMDLTPLYARRDPKRVDLAPRGESGRQAKRSRHLRIKTGLQPLRLPAGFALPNRGSRTNGAPASQALPDRSEGPSGLSPEPLHRSSGHGLVASRPMCEHLETMDRFLRLQADVMTKYLGRRSARRVPAPARSEAALRLPFVGHVEELVPGQRAVVSRRIDPKEDCWIRDHVLGRRVSIDDPELDALPVVPLTISMEILAEAASLLQSGRPLVGMKDVRAYRWIALDSTELTLRVTAEATPGRPGEVHARIRNQESGIGNQESGIRNRESGIGSQEASGERRGASTPTVLVEATLLFADAYPAPKLADPFTIVDEGASEWTPDRLYRDGMFHGPAFRSVQSVDRTGSDGASATLQSLPTERLFASRPEPRFHLDPVLLDGAGQVLAFWAKERLEPGVDVFPYRVGSLRLYGSVPSRGEQMTCRVRAGALGNDRTRCDFALVDAKGFVYCEVEGWEDRRFRLPRTLVTLQVEPQLTYLSRSWQSSVDDVAPPDEVACTRLDDLPETLLLGHGAIWMSVLAHVVLSRRERDLWRQLPAAPARRCEWLLGRVAAKDAVRQLLAGRFGVDLCPADVEVLPDESGRPRVSGAWQAALECSAAISISHVRGAAVALATLDPDKLVGIDIERVSERHEGFETAAFDQEELRRLRLPGSTNEWLLRGWCAKEAAGKALGRGLSQGLLSLAVRDVDHDAGWVTIQARADRAAWPQEAPLQALTRREDDLVAAVVVATRDGRPDEAFPRAEEAAM